MAENLTNKLLEMFDFMDEDEEDEEDEEEEEDDEEDDFIDREKAVFSSELDNRMNQCHQTRNARTMFDHGEAKRRIRKDFFPDDSSDPTFDESGFIRYFRVSRCRFERFMEDFVAFDEPFYKDTLQPNGKEAVCLEARIHLHSYSKLQLL